MKRLLAVLLAVLVALPLVVHPVLAVDEPQRVFDIDMMIQVSQIQINGSLTWAGSFNVYARLIDPNYRAYLESLAEKNRTRAEEQFQKLVYDLVYDNLKRNFNERLSGSNLSAIVYIPPGGPVRLGKNWSAIVTFTLVPFFVSEGNRLICPFYGPLDFVFSGKVYSYSWNKLTLVLPKDYNVSSLVPKPDQFEENVAVWYNGSFIPYIEVFNPVYLFGIFINSTKKTLSIAFDPDDGYVQFNATFVGMKPSPSITNMLLSTFRGSMNIISISAQELPNGVRVIGVARPSVAHKETRTKRVWVVLIKLPGKFDKIEVRGGTYKLAPDGTLVLTFKERKTDYVRYAIPLVLAVGVVGLLWFRHRKKSKPSEGETPDIGELSERVELVELEEEGEDEGEKP